MAEKKKITVLGDAGDLSLTPEEEHKIEVKVDKMLAVNDQPAPEQLLEHQSEAQVAPLDEVAGDEPEPAGAPPVDKKLVKKIAIVDKSADAEVIDSVKETPAPEAEPEPEMEPIEPAAPVEPAEEPEEPKKYRPPDGPMPFKRAPSPDVVPPEAAAAANLSAEEQEDAAIAEAFAAKPKAANAVQTPQRPSRAKLIVALIIIVIVAAAGSVAAVPSWRQAVTKLIHPKTTTKTVSPPATKPVPTVSTTTPAAPVPDIFLAKQDGIYNLYRVDQTGQNQQKLLAGTGYETSSTTQMIANATGGLAAVVSLRDNTKDSAGYPLPTLTLVDTATAVATKLDQAQRLQLLGWYGSRIVYVVGKTGATTANDPNNYQLIAYDATTKQKQVLDHAAYFTVAQAVNGKIYYATDGTSGALYRIDPTTAVKQTVLSKLVTALYRTDYTDLALATANGWYTLNLANSNAQPVSTVNAYAGTNKRYVDSPDKTASLHIETQNGAATLLLYKPTTGKDTVLSQKAGTSYPIHWLSNTLAVFRIDTETETADYTVNVTTGVVSKLVNTSSFHGLEP